MKKFLTSLRNRYKRRAELLESKGIFGYVRSETGYVLIIVLTVCSLLITVSGEFLVNIQADILYMGRFRDDPQAQELAEIGLKISTYILDLDASGPAGSLVPGRNTPRGVDSYNDVWAAKFPPIPIGDGSVSFEIRDEQAKINLSIVSNEFIDKTAYFNMTQRFFQNMDLPQEIPFSILDWVDPDKNKSGYGAETDDYYITLPRPYKAKNGALDSIGELLMVKNITPEIFMGLGGGNAGKEQDIVDDNMNIKPIEIDQFSVNAPQNTAPPEIPSDTRIGPERSRALPDYFRAFGDRDFNSELNKININTAPYRVISALTPDMTADRVSEIIRRRMTKPFASVDELAQLVPETTYRDRISVSSQIYSIKATGVYRKKIVTIDAVYNRTQKRFYYYSIR